VPREIVLNIFKEVVKEDLLFADQRLFKPCIIREIEELVNGWIKHDVQDLHQFSVFGEEGFAKHRINLDFQEKDGILSYFSSKYKITPDCPPDLAFFYNVQTDCLDPSFLREKDEEEDLEHMEQYNSEEEVEGGEDKMVEEGHESS
jgi:hypothetical protein